MASPTGGSGTGGTKRQSRVERFRKIDPSQLEYPQGDRASHPSLGAGGFGYVRKAVWRCKDHKMYVAVKSFYEDRVDSKGGFVEELRGLALLQTHKHIVLLLGAYNSTDSPYIVLEYAPLSLEKVLHDRPLVNGKKTYTYHYGSDHVMSWSYQMAVGLEYIHDKKFLHRDIKPSNLLLFNEGRLLKFCDFGSSRKLMSVVGLMTSGVGTARYMAPEVITGNSYSKGCDVFSFGIAVWEMIARKRPIIGKAILDLAILYATAKGARPPKITGLPAAISDMIELCWEEPAHRPVMGEIRQKLHFLCQYVDMELPITDTTVSPATLKHTTSVVYSRGDDPSQLSPCETAQTESITLA